MFWYSAKTLPITVQIRIERLAQGHSCRSYMLMDMYWIFQGAGREEIIWLLMVSMVSTSAHTWRQQVASEIYSANVQTFL